MTSSAFWASLSQSARARASSYRQPNACHMAAAARQLLAYSNKLLAVFPQSGTESLPQLDLLFDPLSERELEVLRLVASGASNREIANALVVAVPTVKKHVSNIMSKLNASNRMQAVAEGRNLGLL